MIWVVHLFSCNRPILGAPVLSCALASLPTQRKSYREEKHTQSLKQSPVMQSFKSMYASISSLNTKRTFHTLNVFLQAPLMVTESSSYLVPGIQEHDIIGGQVWLSEVPWYFFNLTDSAEENSDWLCVGLWVYNISFYSVYKKVLSFHSVAYNKSASFVGAAKQTWGIDRVLQTLGGLVILLATKSRPEITWEARKYNSHQAPSRLSHIWCFVCLSRKRITSSNKNDAAALWGSQ